MALLNVALDGTKEIENYLQVNSEVKAILELSYDGSFIADCFVVTEVTEVEQIKKSMGDHRDAYNGYRWYAIYTLENGELKQFHGFDAEAWAEVAHGVESK